jgi:hypothetical protein
MVRLRAFLLGADLQSSLVYVLQVRYKLAEFNKAAEIFATLVDKDSASDVSKVRFLYLLCVMQLYRWQ